MEKSFFQAKVLVKWNICRTFAGEKTRHKANEKKD